MTSARIVAATVALLRGLIRPEASAIQGSDFGAGLDWEQMVAFASAQLVLPALYPAILQTGIVPPEDAVDFLQQITAANATRNVEMYNALLHIGARLNGCGLQPVLLKGAGVLASDPLSASPWRFLSDIDLLVPSPALPNAVAALRDLGFTPRDIDYDPARDAHYPALIAPGRRFAVELHTRLFADSSLPGLEARLPQQALAVLRDGVVFRVPARADRIAHLIAHAQLHHGHFWARRLLLRGFLELSVIASGPQPEGLWETVLQVFASQEQRRAATSFLAAWPLLMGNSALPPAASGDDSAWAADAVVRLGSGTRLRTVSALLAMGRRELARALSDGTVLRRHLRTLFSPSAARTRIARHRDRLRQTYWA